MEIAQLLLSLLHAWGMDPDLDRVCEGKLGLLMPKVPVSFGVLSKGGKAYKLFVFFIFGFFQFELIQTENLFLSRVHVVPTSHLANSS